jgi:Lipocalin-like domain
MKGVLVKTGTLLSLVLVSFALPLPQAVAQSAKDVVGTYRLVFETREQDGKTSQVERNGRLVLDAGGNYVFTTIAPDLPKVASNNRTTATPEETKAIVAGSLTHFGTYSIADKALVFRIQNGTFANWNGAEQKRAFVLNGDELKYTVAAASGGGSVTLTWRRIDH